MDWMIIAAVAFGSAALGMLTQRVIDEQRLRDQRREMQDFHRLRAAELVELNKEAYRRETAHDAERALWMLDREELMSEIAEWRLRSEVYKKGGRRL